MKREFTIQPCSGRCIDIKAGQLIGVIDISGGQVADFFAENSQNTGEFLSPGVTVDCNGSLKIREGDVIYSNLYRPMFRVEQDDVGEHDLLHPCCRREMYDFFYHNGEHHSNCLDNINRVLGETRDIIHPLNIFMHTKINPDGSISVEKPLSKPGDRLVLEALMDMRIAISACSVAESDCNSGCCTAVKAEVWNRE